MLFVCNIRTMCLSGLAIDERSVEIQFQNPLKLIRPRRRASKLRILRLRRTGHAACGFSWRVPARLEPSILAAIQVSDYTDMRCTSVTLMHTRAQASS